MTVPLSDKFAGLQVCTRKTPSLPLDAPQDTKEFTHEGVQLAYSPTTGKIYRLAIMPKKPALAFAKWNLIKAGKLRGKYTVIGINGSMLMAHRVIAQHFLNGGKPINSVLDVDHRVSAKGTSEQDILTNLRIISKSLNSCNSKKPASNTSGYKGVSLDKKDRRWVFQITLNGNTKRQCYFPTPEAAYIAYCAASREYHGEYGYYDKSQLRRAIAAECARMGGDV